MNYTSPIYPVPRRRRWPSASVSVLCLLACGFVLGLMF